MKIAFVAGFGPVVRDMAAARAFYGAGLGIPFEGDESYMFSHALQGVKHKMDDHAADAVAIAICHARSRRLLLGAGR